MATKKAKTISLFELMQRYPTESDAVKYIEHMRWGDTPTCTRCNSQSKITAQTEHLGRYWCGSCRNYFTARTGTPLESTQVDARKWLFAAYLMMTARKGISSLQLSKELSVTQTTAWYMLHRLRAACANGDMVLSGTVEIDETYIGGLEANKHASKRLRSGRGTVGKQAVMGMRERGGRVKAKPIVSANADTLRNEIHASIEVGSQLYTDDHGGYKGLDGVLYRYETVKHSAREYVNGMASTNGIESVWAVLKRGYNGVYHNWSKKHCGRYIDEFAFRLNAGNCTVDTIDRIAALFGSMAGKTMTYEGLTS